MRCLQSNFSTRQFSIHPTDTCCDESLRFKELALADWEIGTLLAYLLGAQSIIFELRLGGAHEVAEEEAPIPEVRDLSDVDFIELDIDICYILFLTLPRSCCKRKYRASFARLWDLV